MVRVMNLRTSETQVYSTDPASAVLAAHAQEHGDWNTWAYWTRYRGLLRRGQFHWFCGDWAARATTS